MPCDLPTQIVFLYLRDLLFSTFKISLPTPIMCGVRTPTRQFSSCILIDTNDNAICFGNSNYSKTSIPLDYQTNVKQICAGSEHTCILLNMEVNYAPNGYQTFRPIQGRNGAPPSEIDMKLDFQETKLITKEDVNKGF